MVAVTKNNIPTQATGYIMRGAIILAAGAVQKRGEAGFRSHDTSEIPYTESQELTLQVHCSAS